MAKDKRQSPSTLLWFIRHKSYVPISEIRRRFVLDGDEGTFIEADDRRKVFVGLPAATAESLEKLAKQGKIGFELSVEFDARVLIGVYPMVPSREPMNGATNGYHPSPRFGGHPANGHEPAHIQAASTVNLPDIHVEKG